jgi:threonine dehydrogenase-like Zn-dependent dehydrogenase
VVDPNAGRRDLAREVGIELTGVNADEFDRVRWDVVIDRISIVRDEISMVGSAASLHTFSRAVEMFAAGAIKSRPMISHAFTLEDYGKAMEMFRNGQGRKLQIQPNATVSSEF